MAGLRLFYITIFNTIIISPSFAGSLTDWAVHEKLEDSCSQTMSLCTFKAHGANFIKIPAQGLKGEKGEKGNQGESKDGLYGEKGLAGEDGQRGSDGLAGTDGIEGERGEKGDKGISGQSGDPGDDKMKGVKGDAGLQGQKGLIGQDGSKGTQGDEGPQGFQGPNGKPGEKGDRGSPGPIGMPGPIGTPGACPCYVDIGNADDTISFGKVMEEPADNVCKASSQPLKNGTYYMGPKGIEVQCVTRVNLTTLTCIPRRDNEKIKTITYNKQGWLSQHNLTIEDIYGITREQLAWIQKMSETAFQTIRYHCLNSNPFPRDNIEQSLQLLTWNERTIGPMPTLAKTFFYSVDTDGCSNATDSAAWTYTDLKLVSNTNQRVPVIDFFVKDIRPAVTQSVKIEHIELCFD